MIKHVLLALVLTMVFTGAAEAQDPRAVEERGPGAGDAKRPARSTGGLAADSSWQTAVPKLRQRGRAAPRERIRPGRKLTVRQKRLFVLGLWAADEK